MIIYGLKNCDTCRKARQSLPDADLVDVRTDGVPGDVMARAFAQFGTALVNTRSTTWRGLSASDRERDPIALMSDHPTLMKRPLIAVGNMLFLGWTRDIEADVNAQL